MGDEFGAVSVAGFADVEPCLGVDGVAVPGLLQQFEHIALGDTLLDPAGQDLGGSFSLRLLGRLVNRNGSPAASNRPPARWGAAVKPPRCPAHCLNGSGPSAIWSPPIEIVRNKIDNLEHTIHERLEGAERLDRATSTDRLHGYRCPAIHQRPPYGEKHPDCLRDTVIGHTLVFIAITNPDAEVWFLSNNTDNFGLKEENSTVKGRKTLSDGLLSFAPELGEHGPSDLCTT